VIGDNVGYAIGRFGGRRLIARLGVPRNRLERVQCFFRRYGGALVVVARFFEVFRQLNGVGAGLLSMRWWPFLACNAVGAGLWVGVWGVGVYTLGHHVESVLRVARQSGPVICCAPPRVEAQPGFRGRCAQASRFLEDGDRLVRDLQHADLAADPVCTTARG